MIQIDREKCRNCSACQDVCPSYVFGKEMRPGGMVVQIRHPEFCIACGHCLAVCPHGALSYPELPADGFVPLPIPAVDRAALKNLMVARRSIRKYREEAVPEEFIQDLIEVGTHAGTASNLQCVHFIRIENGDLIRKLEEAVIEVMWRGGLKYFGGKRGIRAGLARRKVGQEMAARMDRTSNIIRRRRERSETEGMIFRGAPLLILAYDGAENLMGPVNCAIALRNMELLAESGGLGSCWAGFLMTAALREPRVINGMLGLDLSQRIYGGLMFGWPKNRYLKTIPRRAREVKKI